MSEDKIVKFPTEAINDLPPLPEGMIYTSELPPCFNVSTDDLTLEPSQDWQALYNMRQWLEKCVEAQGAKVTDAGCGCGGADIGIELEGFAYGITIKPRAMQKVGG